MFFIPEKLALAGVMVYISLWLIAPLKADSPLSISAIIFIVLCYGAFVLGCKVAGKMQARRGFITKSVSGEVASTFWNWYAVWMALGIFGLLLRFYDKFVLRNAIVIGSALETREALADSAAGVLSAIGGALYPFCYLPLFMIWVKERQSVNTDVRLKWLAIAVAMLPAVEALMLLSRSQMLLTFGMVYFGVSCTRYGGLALPKKLIFPILIGLIVLVGVSTVTFLIRLDEMERVLQDSLNTSAYAELLGPSNWAMSIILEEDSIFSIVIANVIPFFQYYLHGLYEFCLLWNRSDIQIHSFGVEHFFPYIKLAAIFGIVEKSLTFQDLYLREGVFTTFFGPLWVDFGWLGMFAIFVFGYVAKRISMAAQNDVPSAIPLHSYFCVVIFFIPVVNLVASAQGMYVANAFIFFYFLMKKVFL